jgi:hypothetical protein
MLLTESNYIRSREEARAARVHPSNADPAVAGPKVAGRNEE